MKVFKKKNNLYMVFLCLFVARNSSIPKAGLLAEVIFSCSTAFAKQSLKKKHIHFFKGTKYKYLPRVATGICIFFPSPCCDWKRKRRVFGGKQQRCQLLVHWALRAKQRRKQHLIKGLD